jgi:hypothetical protein
MERLDKALSLVIKASLAILLVLVAVAVFKGAVAYKEMADASKEVAAAYRKQIEPDDPYIWLAKRLGEPPARPSDFWSFWFRLERETGIPADVARYAFYALAIGIPALIVVRRKGR